MATRDYAKATPAGFSKPSQVVDGGLICAGIDPAGELGRLAVDVAKRLPGAMVDAERFAYGHYIGMCSIYPDGRRRAIRFDAAALATQDAATIADMLTVS